MVVYQKFCQTLIYDKITDFCKYAESYYSKFAGKQVQIAFVILGQLNSQISFEFFDAVVPKHLFSFQILFRTMVINNQGNQTREFVLC